MILSVCPNPSIDAYAWLNNFEPGGVNRISRIKEFPGGKGVHVALAVAELGADSNLMGTWAGNNGQWIRKSCQEWGVLSAGPEVPGDNRKCFTFRSENPNFNNSELLEPGPELSFEAWEEFQKIFQKEIQKSSLVCMSGSWPKKAPVSAYRNLIETANNQGIKILLDCSGPLLLEAVKTTFFGLHLNEEEALKLCGSSHLEDLLEQLEDRVELVALTKGKEGLELYYKGEMVFANVDIDKVVSTVGSGDCLTAGIAFALEKGLSIKEIAAHGVACGAANCLTEDLGMLKNADVEKLLPQVHLKKTGK